MTQEQKLLIDALCVAVTGKHRELNISVDWPGFLQLQTAIS